jgi:hypothetical protein
MSPGRDHHDLELFQGRVDGQSVAAMVEVAWMVNEWPADRHGAEIPVKESREIRYFLRLVGTYFRRRRLQQRKRRRL